MVNTANINKVRPGVIQQRYFTKRYTKPGQTLINQTPLFEYLQTDFSIETVKMFI